MAPLPPVAAVAVTTTTANSTWRDAPTTRVWYWSSSKMVLNKAVLAFEGFLLLFFVARVETLRTTTRRLRLPSALRAPPAPRPPRRVALARAPKRRSRRRRVGASSPEGAPRPAPRGSDTRAKAASAGTGSEACRRAKTRPRLQGTRRRRRTTTTTTIGVSNPSRISGWHFGCRCCCCCCYCCAERKSLP